MKRFHSTVTQIDLNHALSAEKSLNLIKIDTLIPSKDLLNYLLQLNSSLDIAQIIQTIARTLSNHMQFEHLQFENEAVNCHICIGQRQINYFEYNVIDEKDQYLGKLTLSRKVPFDENEVAIFETLICYAMFSIRNNLDYQHILQSSLTDPLTDLGNRRAMEKALHHERELAKRYNQTFSVLAIDIDDFKQINDSYGHETGDILLRKISEEFRKYVRDYDEIFRTGGEEFIIVLNQAEADTALSVAYRIRQNIDKQHFIIKNASIHATVSVGVAIYTSGDDMSVLLERADQALYRAKSQGKNCIRT